MSATPTRIQCGDSCLILRPRSPRISQQCGCGRVKWVLQGSAGRGGLGRPGEPSDGTSDCVLNIKTHLHRDHSCAMFIGVRIIQHSYLKPYGLQFPPNISRCVGPGAVFDSLIWPPPLQTGRRARQPRLISLQVPHWFGYNCSAGRSGDWNDRTAAAAHRIDKTGKTYYRLSVINSFVQL